MTTITATMARKKLYKLLTEVQESHQPVCITGKHGTAILISQDDYATIQETLYLQSIPGMTQSIIKGMRTSVRKCSKKLQE